MNDTAPEAPANYIDALAAEIGDLIPDPGCPQALLRLYALLVLTRGTLASLEDIHDAWSTWRTADAPRHPALIPFSDLSPEVQELDAPYAEAVQMVASAREAARPPVICLCGSARFTEEYREWLIRLVMAGHTVVGTPALELDPRSVATVEAVRAAHLRLIRMSDEVFVINPQGYIGDDTRAEIDYAFTAGKQVRFLESMPLADAYAEGWVPGAPRAVRA